MSRLSFTEALDQALELLEQGHPLEYCVRQFPEYADELRPLLQVSDDLHRLADASLPAFTKTTVEPDWEAILADVPQEAPRRLKTYGIGLNQFLRNLQQHPIQRYASLAAAVVILVVLALRTSSQSAPDSPLYGLKRAVEQVQVITTTDPQQRVELRIKFARRRLSELQTLAYQNQDIQQPLLDQALAETKSAVDEAKAAKVGTSVYAELTSLLTETDSSLSRLKTDVPIANTVVLESAASKVDALRDNLEQTVAVEQATPTPTATSVSTPTPTDIPAASVASGSQEAADATGTSGTTEQPTKAPTNTPPAKAIGIGPTATAVPTAVPTDMPTDTPTGQPTEVPTNTPTTEPTAVPTDPPTSTPSASAPTTLPTQMPPIATIAITITIVPPGPTTTMEPTATPTSAPTQPATPEPTIVPTSEPTQTSEPTVDPTTIVTTPTESPTPVATAVGTETPTQAPTETTQPTEVPTEVPTTQTTPTTIVSSSVTHLSIGVSTVKSGARPIAYRMYASRLQHTTTEPQAITEPVQAHTPVAAGTAAVRVIELPATASTSSLAVTSDKDALEPDVRLQIRIVPIRGRSDVNRSP